MHKEKVLVLFFVLIILVNSVYAASIYGTIYDFSLKKINNAIVEINTIPKQIIVAQNSTYSFNVPNGRYTITTKLMQKNSVIASSQENLTIMQDGSYVLDLILFPDVEEGIEEPGIEVNSDVSGGSTNNRVILVFIVLVILGIVVGAVYYNKTHKKKNFEAKEERTGNEDSGLEDVIKIIKQEGGRATQKDIRKQIPLSEAKISLMIAELEHKEIIEKIKKGRGNIIILKKR